MMEIPWLVWGFGALTVALIFAFFVPNAAKVNAAEGLRFIIARWFHSLVWLLLAVSFFLRGSELSNLANPVALAGGVVYLFYLAVFLTL